MESTNEQYPEWYTMGHFDGAMVYCESDSDIANSFKNLLERIVVDPIDGNYPRLCAIESLMFSNSGLHQVETLLDKSTFIFLLVTDAFIDDRYCQMLKDELIMHTIENVDERWKIIPVYPCKLTKRVPLGIKALNGISLNRLVRLTGDVKTSLPFINSHNIEQLDRYFKTNMEKLFRNKKYLKLNRERDDVIALRHWVEEHNSVDV